MSDHRDGTQRPLGLNLGLWDRMTSWAETIEIVRLAEELGYECVSIPESFGRDGFTLCDRMLAATSRIKVNLGLANVFSRSPAVLAQTAATLDELSGGRFILGLGSSTPNLVEGWHGLRYEKPLQRTRETIDLCRRIWSRDRSPYHGSIFRAGGVKMTFAPTSESIPIWHGALLENSMKLCGEMADGWIPNLLPVDGIAPGKATLEAAARGAGRAEDPVKVVPSMQLMVGEDPSQLLPLIKFGLAIYYGPETSPYAKIAARVGYADDVAALRQAYAEGGSEAAVAATSDALARSVGIVGSIEQCRQQLDLVYEQGADLVFLSMPAATRKQCEPILEGMISG